MLLGPEYRFADTSVRICDFISPVVTAEASEVPFEGLPEPSSSSGIIRVSDEEEEVGVEVEELSLASAPPPPNPRKRRLALLPYSARAFDIGQGRWVEVPRIAKPKATDTGVLFVDFRQVLNRLVRAPPQRPARIPLPEIKIYSPLIEGLVDGVLICRERLGEKERPASLTRFVARALVW